MSNPPTPGTPGWNEYLAEGNAKQARKRVAADALIRDQDGRVLLVLPTYKEGWDLPGGMAEANEAPVDALRRELREELGLELPILTLLCLDWVPPHGPWDDLLSFIFDAGSITAQASAALHPHDRELSRCAFFDEPRALELLTGRQNRRFAYALDAQRQEKTIYLENGQPPF